MVACHFLLANFLIKVGIGSRDYDVKVSKSQNKFMKSSFLPKNEQNIARISALNVRAIFRSLFGKKMTS